MKIINAECSAVLRMLNRSSAKLVSNDYICRNLYTTALMFDSDSNKEPKASVEGDGKTAPSQNDSSSSKPPNKKKPSNKKKPPPEDDANVTLTMFAKGLLWTSFVYSCAVLLGLLMKRGDQPEAHDNREISWNEFVHHMLMAGEVKQITVVPDFDTVTIRLHNDAIVKGRRVRNPIFYMTIPDSIKVEEKIRDVERKMGIKDGKRHAVSV